MHNRALTVPSHSFEPTSNPDTFRFVNREGKWDYYWIKSRKIFVPAVSHIIETGYPKGERFYNYLLNATPEEAARRLATAGEEGARTHDAIRDLLDGKKVTLETKYYNELTDELEPLTYNEWRNLQAFARWSEEYQPQKIFHEYTVWSEKHKYAGTADFVGTIFVPESDKFFPIETKGKRILILIDWKTSSGIWEDYELQVAAYREALIEQKPSELLLDTFTEFWTGIVRLGTRHATRYEMRVWNNEESELNFNLFTAAYKIYVRKGGEVFEPEIEQIPTEIKVNIPAFSSSLLNHKSPKRTKK